MMGYRPSTHFAHQFFGAKNELVDESHAISVSVRLFRARIDGDLSKSSEPGRQPQGPARPPREDEGRYVP